MQHVSIVGVGPGTESYMTHAAICALEASDVVIGASRVLAALPERIEAARVEEYRAAEIISFLRSHPHYAHACVLVSGDPGIYSAASHTQELIAQFPDEFSLNVIPGISTVSYFAAAIGRSWENWRVMSAHGLTCDIVAQARRGGSVFVLTSDGQTPAQLCDTVSRAGFGNAAVTVAERLSYPDERITHAQAFELVAHEFNPLNVVLFDFGSAYTPVWPYVSGGIPDSMFIQGDVPLTKREVRVLALSSLRIAPDSVVWDVGAGTGSVSVEAALFARAGRVWAVERSHEAAMLIRKNFARFQLSNVELIEGEAPQALCQLPAPDAVFIGGTRGHLRDIVAAALKANPHVRIALTCVSLETLKDATALFAGTSEGPRFEDVNVCQAAVSRVESAGTHHLMRALNPVFIVSAQGAR